MPPAKLCRSRPSLYIPEWELPWDQLSSSPPGMSLSTAPPSYRPEIGVGRTPSHEVRTSTAVWLAQLVHHWPTNAATRVRSQWGWARLPSGVSQDLDTYPGFPHQNRPHISTEDRQYTDANCVRHYVRTMCMYGRHSFWNANRKSTHIWKYLHIHRYHKYIAKATECWTTILKDTSLERNLCSFCVNSG